MDEGHIREIYDTFFRKLVMRYCPEDKSVREFLEDLFNVDHRNITIWKSKRGFRMPGLHYLTGNVKVQGIGFRDVTPNSLLWVREDTKNPGYYDVEFMGGQGGGEQVYQLTASEWLSIQIHCDPIDQVQAA